MYKNDEKLSTFSLEFDELPLTIASLYPWFVVSTSVGLLIFAPDHDSTILQRKLSNLTKAFRLTHPENPSRGLPPSIP